MYPLPVTRSPSLSAQPLSVPVGVMTAFSPWITCEIELTVHRRVSGEHLKGHFPVRVHQAEPHYLEPFPAQQLDGFDHRWL